MVTYRLDKFDELGWEKFRDTGATVREFPQVDRSAAKKVNQGDVLLCYVTNAKLWVGALEVVEQVMLLNLY